MPVPPDAFTRGRAALHLWPGPGDAARVRAATRVAGGGAGVFGHQFHPARHRDRAPDGALAAQSDAADGPVVSPQPGRQRGDRALHLARPRAAGRSARRERLRPRGRVGACRAVRNGGRRARRRAAHAGGAHRRCRRDAHPAVGHAHAGVGSTARRLAGWRRLFGRHDWSYRVHRDGAVDRLPARDRLDAAQQPRSSDPASRHRHRRVAPPGRRPESWRPSDAAGAYHSATGQRELFRGHARGHGARVSGGAERLRRHQPDLARRHADADRPGCSPTATRR